MVAAGHTCLLPANHHLSDDAFPAANDGHHAHPGLPGAHLFPKQSFPGAQVGYLFYSIYLYLCIIYFTSFVGILLLFISRFYFHFSSKCCFLHCLCNMCFINKELQKQIQNHLTDLSLFCVCQVRCCHCRCGPPIFCCRGSQFNGQGGTQSPAVHVEPADVPVLSDSDNNLPHHTLPSMPRPS